MTDSKTARSRIASRPTVFGVFLGGVIHIMGWFLLATEMTPIALAFVTLGVTLVYWSQQWWPDVGRVLTAVGVVLLLDDISTELLSSGPILPGL